MKIYDITLPMHSKLLLWPGSRPNTFDKIATVEKDGYGESFFSFGNHTGTHIDAPNHFVKGATGIDKIALEKLVGPCKVVDLTKIDHKEILVSDIKDTKLHKGAKILFKTGNYKYLHGSKFPDSYVSLSLAAAEYLAEKEIDLVGIDFLGIEKRKNPGHPVHVTLLKAGIVNLEGLDLSKVPAGKYQLIALPINVIGADGAPTRAVLIKP